MSPASKSKSRDKKVGTESQKASVKIPGAGNAGSGVPASAYNPLLGTFHTLEAMPAYSAPSIHSNSRFRNIDDTDDHSGNSLGTGPEYDSVSNNGSWSGESEDHKEKAPNPTIKQESIPGADNDKREKIRQKNERKHKRQKERRAQELHERCSGYLMSRKLEALAQQLVSMGFSSERATMALILNEGRVEDSVTWLFEGHEEAGKSIEQGTGNGSKWKIDISEELARIADMEIRYGCSKQEVERAIVACEGDLVKAGESLRVQKQDRPSTPEETCDPPKISDGKQSAAANPSLMRPPQKFNSSTSMLQSKDEKDLNYIKSATGVGSPSDSGSKPALRRMQPKLEGSRPHQIATSADKRWATGGSNLSVSSGPSAAPLQVSLPPVKLENNLAAVGSEPKNLQLGRVREPFIMMQRPKGIGAEHTPSTSISLSGPGTGWHPSGVELKSSGLLQQMSSTRSISPDSLCLNRMYLQNHNPHQPFNQGCSPGDFPAASNGAGTWSRNGSSPTIAAASSLGLFSGVGLSGSSGSSSALDWNTDGSARTFDYTCVDWSLDRGMSSSKANGLWLGMTPSMNPRDQKADVSGVGLKPTMRLTPSNNNGVPVLGFKNGGEAPAETFGATSPEWTSPFEGQDLFSLPRQYVSSPSL